MTKYELARVISARVVQLSRGDEPKVDNVDDLFDNYEIAFEELRQGKMPIAIIRENEFGEKEEVFVNEMNVLDH